jgi:hypothetical protein
MAIVKFMCFKEKTYDKPLVMRETSMSTNNIMTKGLGGLNMGEEKEKREYITGLTMKSLVVGLVACIFGVVTQYQSQIGFATGAYHWWAMAWQPVLSMGTAFAFMFILAFLNYGASAGWWKVRFSRQEACVVLLFTLVANFGTNQNNYSWFYRELFQEGQWIATQPAAKQAAYWALMPKNLVLGPLSAEPYAPLIKTGFKTLAIDLAPFMPMIIAGVLWFLSLELFITFGSLLLRRLYIDVEYLPMPISRVMSDVIELTQPMESWSLSRKVKFFASKLFLVGFLASFIPYFVLYALGPLISLVTGAPVTLPWTGVNFEPAWDFTKYSWLQWSGFTISLMPWEIGWAVLLPINVLITVVISWVAIYVIFAFIYCATYWPPYPPGSMIEIDSLIYGPWLHDAQGFSRPALLTGMMFGAAIVPVILNWKQMAPIFKSLIKEPAKEFDPERPLSYRLTWILTIGFFLLWFIVSVALYLMQPLPTIVFMILASLVYFGSSRLVSETGGFYGALESGPCWMSMTYSGMPGAIAMAYTADIKSDISTYMTMYMINNAPHTTCQVGDRPAINTLNSFAISHRTRTAFKTTLMILVIGVIISVVLSAFVHFFIRTWSITMAKTRGTYIKTIVTYANQGRFYAYYDVFSSHPNEALIQIVLGFAIIFALAYLAPRIGLLRGLSIGGIILGFMVGFYLWAPFLVGFLIKYLVIRVAGTRGYEEKLAPIGLGIVVGTWIVVFITQFIGWLNWLIY